MNCTPTIDELWPTHYYHFDTLTPLSIHDLTTSPHGPIHSINYPGLLFQPLPLDQDRDALPQQREELLFSVSHAQQPTEPEFDSSLGSRRAPPPRSKEREKEAFCWWRFSREDYDLTKQLASKSIRDRRQDRSIQLSSSFTGTARGV